MAITKAQGAQIRSLMREERWNAVQLFLAQKIDQWREQKVNGTTAFEELRALHTRDGKVEGLLEFFDQLEKQAFED